jgi:phage terminase small subunit
MSREIAADQDLFKDAPLWWEGLTGRRRLFVEYYCTDRTCFLNATQAYIKAYSSEVKKLSDSSIQSNASRLTREPKIKAAISKLLRAQQNENDKITEFEILNALRTLSLYNPKDILNQQGELVKSLEELGELSICITAIEKNKNGGYKIKLYDRTKSIAMLCNYLNITREIGGNTIINPVVYLPDKDVEAMREDIPQAEEAEYSLVEAGA